MEQPVQFLSAAKILALWESGRPQHALDRALTVLAAASPGADRAALADLPIGERDARLLRLRAQTFGAPAEGFAECPRCAEWVEFSFDTGTLATEEGATACSSPASVHAVQMDGIPIHFRLPTSRDLGEVVRAPDASGGLRRLVDSCVRLPNESYLPDETIEKIGRAMLEADPRAEIILRLTCPTCAHEWDLLFDIAEFFWTEVSVQAQRLLREIDTLARAYGWTEREILSLPAQRRQTYLEMLAG